MTTTTASPVIEAGAEASEPECKGKKSKDGKHCWHPTDNYRVGDAGAMRMFVCCNCDAKMFTPEPVLDPAQHGPHLPAYWWMG